MKFFPIAFSERDDQVVRLVREELAAVDDSGVVVEPGPTPGPAPSTPPEQ